MIQTIDISNIEDRTLNLWKKLLKIIAPPPDLTVSEWADLYRKLSPEASAEPGQWRTDRAPYQREIMNAVTDKKTERIVMMTSAQVGKTELELNILGYHIDYDPAPILLVQPSDGMAETFSKDRLAPMIRDCPKLSSKVKEAKSRNSGNTKLHKSFPGGHVTMIGANTPKQLASRPIRIVLFDEVDRFPVSAGTEGDPIALATKRTNTFWNRKIIEVSTPTIKGASKIELEYGLSTQEEWNLECPHCGEYQPLEWERVQYTIENEELTGVDGMACKYCGAIGTELEWKKGLLKGKWIAKYPEKFKVRGFHLNEFTSPWKTWAEIVEDYLKAKTKPEELKIWWNTALGLPYEELGDLDADELLARRREMYNLLDKDIPLQVLVLTAAVDVQDNRLEYEIVGWGVGKESWGIEYGVIMGDPGQEDVWKKLDIVLQKSYVRSDGTIFKIISTCIDSGGHFTTEVYEYCKKRESERVWAIKGKGGSGIPFIQRPKARNKAGVWLFIIGTDVGKDTLASRLKVNDPGKPGFCNFPMESERGYDEEYFKGLTAENRKVLYQSGKVIIRWEKKTSGARNEPFDLKNYNNAALEIYNPDLEELAKHYQDGEIIKAPVVVKKKRRIISKGIG